MSANINGYFPTSDVVVFPSAYRIANASGRFTSEKNITNMIISLFTGNDSKSFVVDFSGTDGTSPTAGVLKVVVGGYYFEIKDFTPAGTQFLNIRIVSDYLARFDNSSLVDLDNSGTCLCICLQSAAGGNYSLQITKDGKIINRGFIKDLTDEDGNWINISNLIMTSEGKIDINSLDFTTLTNYVYAKFLIAEGATRLFDSTDAHNPFNFGNDDADLIAFNNGYPVKSTKTVGSINQPIYLNSGTFNPISTNVQGNGLEKYFTSLNNGVITTGNKVTISDSLPTGSGNTGDLWFVIGN